ncbi:15473_t:CDS:2, partial [Racocetra persica]
MDSEDSLQFNETSSETSISCLNDDIVTTHSIDNNQSKKRGGQCDMLKNDSTKCNHIIETDSNTKNFSYHLHITHGDNVEYKEQVDSMVAEFLISDSQPFSVLENPAFKKLLKKLNPYYEIPCDKGIKARICMSYNWMLATLQDILKNSMNYCGLTIDLWTSRNESEVLNTEFETKINQTKINIPQEYLIREALLAILLDPRNKKIEFATYSQRLEAEAYLVAEYEVFKEQESILTNIVQMDNLEEEENVLLAIMYKPIQESDINNEIQTYFALPKIS